MHRIIVQKIKTLREEKGFTQLQMADIIHVDLSTYKRIEKPDSTTWAKYLEDILSALEISQKDFFRDLAINDNIKSELGLFGRYTLTIESVLAENKEKTNKIIELYEQRLKEKDLVNSERDKLITELKEISKLKDKIIEKLDSL